MIGSQRRVLRSTAGPNPSPSSSSTPGATTSVSAPSPLRFSSSTASPPLPSIRLLAPGSVLPNTSASSVRLLRQKQSRLASTAPATSALALAHPPASTGGAPASTHDALLATLIFAQHEAGTAVCIHPSGWLLTCSHCIGETEAEWRASKRKWLLFYTGLAVLAECRVWDAARDLALCKIVAVEAAAPTGAGSDEIEGLPSAVPLFAFIRPAERAPRAGESIACIGQPGRDDLESATAKRTKYNLVEISEGRFCGMVRGADPQDNSEIGTLKHDAWTYWGHSGAPLVARRDGSLVGLHSSWDEKTGMRHGIPLVAIRRFLEMYLKVEEGTGDGAEASRVSQMEVVVGQVRLVEGRVEAKGGGGGESESAGNSEMKAKGFSSRKAEEHRAGVEKANGSQGTTLASAIVIEDDSNIATDED